MKAKNAPFFYKECKRTQRTKHSFIKNAKEYKNVAFFLKERLPNPGVQRGSLKLVRGQRGQPLASQCTEWQPQTCQGAASS